VLTVPNRGATTARWGPRASGNSLQPAETLLVTSSRCTPLQHPDPSYSLLTPHALPRRDMSQRYGIKHFYDITDRSNFRANPDYKGVCHIAMAQEGHCLPGAQH